MQSIGNLEKYCLSDLKKMLNRFLNIKCTSIKGESLVFSKQLLSVTCFNYTNVILSQILNFSVLYQFVKNVLNCNVKFVNSYCCCPNLLFPAPYEAQQPYFAKKLIILK